MIDLDKLEAMVREEREQYRLSLVFPEMLSVLAEVRSLRGIAEAARDYQKAVEAERKWDAEADLSEPLPDEEAKAFVMLATKRMIGQSMLFEALAAYDKEGSK